MSNVFWEVVHVSALSSIFIVIMLIVNKVSAKYYSLRWMQLLWCLLAVRLLLPGNLFTVVLPESARNISGVVNQVSSVERNSPAYVVNSVMKSSDEKNTLQQQESIVPKAVEQVMKPTSNIAAILTVMRNGVAAISILWIFGVLWQVLKYSISYYIFLRKLKKDNRKIEDTGYLSIFRDMNKKQKKITMFRNAQINAPFSAGLFKKSIVLPEREYSEQEVEVILLHEYTHIVNHDMWFKLLICLAKSVHWFNPLVYQMERVVNQNMELRCDEEVVREQTVDYRKMYGQTILNTLQELNTRPALMFVSHFEGEGKQLKERFRNIMKPSNKNKVPIIISLISVIVIAASVITCQSVNGDSKVQEAIKTAVSTPETVKEEKAVTVLVAGSENINDVVGRSDSMFLAKWDPKSRKVSISSLCRDLYVDIPGYASNKLNAAFHLGGMKLLKQTVEENFDVKIDYTVIVNFDGCEKLVDAMGGVPITLTKAEADYLNRTNYISKKSNRNLREGECLLNGNQALGYARVRYVSTANGTQNDFGRVERLQGMLQAMLNKLDTLSLLQYSSLVKEGLESIDTDLTLPICLDLIGNLEKEEYTYSSLTIPVEGSFESARRGDCYVLKWDKDINKAALQ